MGVPGTLQCSMIPVYVNVQGKTRLQEKKRERIVDDGLYSFGSIRFDSIQARHTEPVSVSVSKLGWFANKPSILADLVTFRSY